MTVQNDTNIDLDLGLFVKQLNEDIKKHKEMALEKNIIRQSKGIPYECTLTGVPGPWCAECKKKYECL